MSDILTRLEMAVAENSTAAIINIVKGELMDAVGKTVVELPCEVGEKVYLIGYKRTVEEYPIIEFIFDKSIFVVIDFEDRFAISINEVYFDLKTATDALGRGEG
jgi:hypothetical protein